MDISAFIDCFLSLNPRPSPEQVRCLKVALGISDFEAPDFTQDVLRAAVKKYRLCALTEGERVLNNDYDPALTETDNLLINDGDNLTQETRLGDQDALGVDGIVDDSSIADFEAKNGRV